MPKKSIHRFNYNNNNKNQFNIIPVIKGNDSNNNGNIFYHPNANYFIIIIIKIF